MAIQSGSTQINGTELYHEVRGTGPTVLLIHGAFLDAGCYDALADILAKDFTVVTYDRRGYSRSPRPQGWSQTSVEEQADDADALLTTLGLAPATVFGSSSAGLIALDLAIRHADHLRGAILHESGIFACLPPAYVEEQLGGFSAMIEQAVATGGPRAGQQTLLGALAGEGGFESLATESLRTRWLSNAELVFGTEFPNMLMTYRPSGDAITMIRVPVQVMRAEDSVPINIAASEWLAAQTKTSLLESPGSHLAYINRPQGVAAAIRPFLARPLAQAMRA
jgi:pimeloyl-ACP methyl ester carboxylesterase